MKRASEALHEAQTQLAHVNRVTTVGQLAASITHEINQPLAAVVNNGNACLRWLAAQNLEEARRSAELVIADGHRASDIVSRIRALFKKAPLQNSAVDVNEAILEVISLTHGEVVKYGVAAQTQLAQGFAAYSRRSSPTAASDS